MELCRFLSSLAQDFIEDCSRRTGCRWGRGFLSSLAQDFIEDLKTLKRGIGQG